MKKLLWSSVITLLILASGCNKAVDADYPGRISYQVPGCVKKIYLDSCFSYTFQNTLRTDFCIYANCCPDSNRFSFEHDITADSIKLYVTDFEDNLCHCICNYNLHTSFIELPLDSYQFVIYSRYKDSEFELLYSEKVYRRL
jgi:hypothetical protein